MTSAILETLGYRAPLALRCRDAATTVDVADGIVATAWPVGDPGATRVASVSKVSTLLGFGTLPGLWAQTYARADGSADLAWPVTPTVAFLVSVVDIQGRYLPTLFARQLPVAAPVDVALYTAPSRRPPSAWACVGGELHLETDGTAAAWALVDLAVDGDTYTALCDDRGRFLTYFPYPDALPPLTGSPPHGTGLAAVSWPVAASVRYSPSVLDWPVNPPPNGPPDATSIQAQTVALVGFVNATAPDVTVSLQFGSALQLLLKVAPT